MNREVRAIGLLIITVLFWGISFISIKEALGAFPPMSLGLARFSLALIVLAPLKRIMARDDRIAGRDLAQAALGGLIGVSLYFFMENNGVALSAPGEASLLIATIPVLTAVSESLFFKARLGARGICGALVSMAGVWILVSAGLSFSGNAAGYLFMAGAAVSWVAYCFVTRGLFARHSRISVVAWQSAFGTIGFIPFAIMELPSLRVPDAGQIAHVAYLGICCSALGYLFYAIALDRLGASRSTVFINLIPLVTVAAEFALGKPLAAEQLAGGAIIVLGVMLATLGGRRALQAG
jgi:drug/metabolite transporter (DMT)-like permease